MCEDVAQLGRHPTAACRCTSIAVMGSSRPAASITSAEARDSAIAAGRSWENRRALLIRLALDPRVVVKGQGCVLRALLITHGQKRLASVDRHGRAIASPVPELLLSRVPIYYFPLASHITPSQLRTPRNVHPPSCFRVSQRSCWPTSRQVQFLLFSSSFPCQLACMHLWGLRCCLDIRVCGTVPPPLATTAYRPS